MSEMIERVARALAFSEGAKMCGPGQNRATKEFGWKGDGVPFEKYVKAHWKEHVHAAGFALSAMREPTQEQYDALSATGRAWKELSSETVWKTYIDAALKE